MTIAESTIESGLRILAVLLAVPLLMMVVAMPLMVLTGGGHGAPGTSVPGWGMLFMPAIPFAVITTIAYVLYTSVGGDNETGGVRERENTRFDNQEVSGHE